MDSSKIQLALRVRVKRNGSIALVVGKPEYYQSHLKLVRIKYENSTRYEYMISNQIEPLPLEQQYPALGGEYKPLSGVI